MGGCVPEVLIVVILQQFECETPSMMNLSIHRTQATMQWRLMVMRMLAILALEEGLV
jgi:hypothetical protein